MATKNKSVSIKINKPSVTLCEFLVLHCSRGDTSSLTESESNRLYAKWLVSGLEATIRGAQS